MNWGTKLIIGMALFISFIVTLGVLMIRSDSDDLVDTDYYEKGIAYDKDYNRKSLVKQDQAEPEIITKDNLTIVFKSRASGSIRFIHPSDKNMDRILNMDSGTGKQVELDLSDFTKGHWKVVLEWKSDGKAYMYEKEISIN